MFSTTDRKYTCRQSLDLIRKANNYIHSHCWGCDKEFEDKEQLFTVIGAPGIYCEDCHDRLESALEVDSTETESKNE